MGTHQSLRTQADTCAKRQRVMAVVLALALAGLYLFGFRPASNRVTALVTETQTRRAEFEAAELRARDLKSVELEVEKLKARLERFDKRLPGLHDLGTEAGLFIGDITQLSQHGSLKKLTYQQGVRQRSELFSELPYSLNFEGDFVGVTSFLQQVELMPRLARVTKLTMKSKDSKVGQVEVQVSMNLYFSDN
jgi:Tfp pilus assembly protein PilO